MSDGGGGGSGACIGSRCVSDDRIAIRSAYSLEIRSASSLDMRPTPSKGSAIRARCSSCIATSSALKQPASATQNANHRQGQGGEDGPARSEAARGAPPTPCTEPPTQQRRGNGPRPTEQLALRARAKEQRGSNACRRSARHRREPERC